MRGKAQNRHNNGLERSLARHAEVDIRELGCVTFSIDGNILESTPIVQKMTGYSGVELSGLKFRNFISGDQVENVEAAFKSASNNSPDPYPSEALVQKSNGDALPCSIHFSPLLNRHKEVTAIAGFIYVHADETAKIRKSEADISKLIGRIGHDIRTPLMSIISATQLLKENPDNIETLVDFLERSSQRLFDTVESVLRLANLDHDFQLQLETGDLHEYLVETVGIFQHLAKEKGLSLKYAGPVDSELVAMFDGAAISRILVNLIDNAMKYTEEGEIKVSFENKGSYVRIEVADTGLGINQNDLPHIFEDFSRFVASDEIKREGLGLGLPITKRLVEMMNGSIRADSTEGKGSCFSIELPLIPVS